MAEANQVHPTGPHLQETVVPDYTTDKPDYETTASFGSGAIGNHAIGTQNLFLGNTTVHVDPRVKNETSTHSGGISTAATESLKLVQDKVRNAYKNKFNGWNRRLITNEIPYIAPDVLVKTAVNGYRTVQTDSALHGLSCVDDIIKRSVDQSRCEPNIVLITGDAGMGKTMILQKWALDWVNGSYSEYPLVLYIPLKMAGGGKLVDIICADLGLDFDDSLRNVFQKVLISNKEKALLLLDGAECYRDIESLKSLWKDIRGVVTITLRPHYMPELQNLQFPRCLVQLQGIEIGLYIVDCGVLEQHDWVKCKTESKILVEDTKRQLEAIEAKMKALVFDPTLLAVPFFLDLALAVVMKMNVRAAAHMAPTVTVFFKEALLAFLKDRNVHITDLKSESPLPSISSNEHKRLISSIGSACYIEICNGKKHSTFLAQEVVRNFNVTPSECDSLAFFSTDESGDHLYFRHRLCKEYFAALYLSNEPARLGLVKAFEILKPRIERQWKTEGEQTQQTLQEIAAPFENVLQFLVGLKATSLSEIPNEWLCVTRDLDQPVACNLQYEAQLVHECPDNRDRRAFVDRLCHAKKIGRSLQTVSPINMFEPFETLQKVMSKEKTCGFLRDMYGLETTPELRIMNCKVIRDSFLLSCLRKCSIKGREMTIRNCPIPCSILNGIVVESLVIEDSILLANEKGDLSFHHMKVDQLKMQNVDGPLHVLLRKCSSHLCTIQSSTVTGICWPMSPVPAIEGDCHMQFCDVKGLDFMNNCVFGTVTHLTLRGCDPVQSSVISHAFPNLKRLEVEHQSSQPPYLDMFVHLDFPPPLTGACSSVIKMTLTKMVVPLMYISKAFPQLKELHLESCCISNEDQRTGQSETQISVDDFSRLSLDDALPKELKLHLVDVENLSHLKASVLPHVTELMLSPFTNKCATSVEWNKVFPAVRSLEICGLERYELLRYCPSVEVEVLSLPDVDSYASAKPSEEDLKKKYFPKLQHCPDTCWTHDAEIKAIIDCQENGDVDHLNAL